MFTSRIAGPLERQGIETRRVSLPEDVTPQVDAVVVDLGGIPAARWEPVLQSAKAKGKPVVGFAPHKMRDILALAKASGFDDVLPNGRMAADPLSVLAPLLKGQGDHAADGPKNEG